MRIWIQAGIVAMVVGTVGAALAGPNANTTLVLHAIQTSYGPCEIDDPCQPEPGSPMIEISEPGESHAVYVIIRNYDSIASVQAALDIDPSWAFQFSLFSCLPNQLDGWPRPPWGPLYGTFTTTFDCISGGSSAVVGRLHFASTPTGCAAFVESAFPFGSYVVNCEGSETDPIAPDNWGRVCVGPGGINTCEPVATPVESATWGRVKGQYEGRGDRDRADYPDLSYQD